MKQASRLINQNSLALFRDSLALADFAQETIKNVSARLTSDILDAAGTDLENAVTIQAMRQLGRHLDEHLAAAETALFEKGKGLFQQGYVNQFETVLEQASAFEAVAPSGITAADMARIVRLQPKVSGSLIKASFEGSLKKLSSSASNVKEPIRQLLAQNVLTGGSYQDLIKTINSTGIVKGPFITTEHRARAIAITETTNIYNTARMDSVIQSNRLLPEGQRLKIRWAALLDSATSARCRSLNGQVREPGKDFVAADGWHGKAPAAHPHCRSEIVPFREAWQSILDELEADLNAESEES